MRRFWFSTLTLRRRFSPPLGLPAMIGRAQVWRKTWTRILLWWASVDAKVMYSSQHLTRLCPHCSPEPQSHVHFVSFLSLQPLYWPQVQTLICFQHTSCDAGEHREAVFLWESSFVVDIPCILQRRLAKGLSLENFARTTIFTAKISPNETSPVRRTFIQKYLSDLPVPRADMYLLAFLAMTLFYVCTSCNQPFQVSWLPNQVFDYEVRSQDVHWLAKTSRIQCSNQIRDSEDILFEPRQAEATANTQMGGRERPAISRFTPGPPRWRPHYASISPGFNLRLDSMCIRSQWQGLLLCAQVSKNNCEVTWTAC